MPRATLTVQPISRAGVQPAYDPAEADGQSFNNTGREVIHVKNGATACNVTVLTARTVDGQAVTNRVVLVPATEERFIGPFPPATFNQGGADGDVVHFDYDDESSVTVAVFRV